MRFNGFVGPTYVLDSVNVDCQRSINLYPEVIESGTGKGAQRAYLKSTPGLRKILEVGNGPIRLVHVDSIGRVFVVSGNQLFLIEKDSGWRIGPVTYTAGTTYAQATDIYTGTETFSNAFPHLLYTGLKVQVSSSVTLPTGLSAATDYWIISVTSTSLRFASSLANALAGTAINITAVGTGTLTITPQIPSLVESIEVDSVLNTFTKTAHGFYTGLKVNVRTMPSTSGGFTMTTDYFVIKTDADNFQLASSIANASAGTAIDFTTVSGDWYQSLMNSQKFQGSARTFGTSTGNIRAASLSYQGDGTDSTTVFVDGNTNMAFWQYSGSSVSFATLSALGYGDVPTATDIVWTDGTFIVNESGTNKFYVSDVQSINIDALTFTSSDGSPDILLALAVNNRILWAFNEKTIELYANTGNADFPFERISGGFLEIGLAAKRSVAKAAGTLFWLGRSEKGQGLVYMASGSNPQRISTHAVEQAIAGYSDITTATAFAYEHLGHVFYVLNFTEATWVYDLSTGLWHERAYTSSGSFERHRADVHAYSSAYDSHIVGDYSSNKVYVLDNDYYFDDTAAITRQRVFPHLSSDGLNRMFCSRLEIDMETGNGLDGTTQGSDPQVMLDWSDDHGHSWGNEHWVSSGGPGAHRTRAVWRRLGSYFDRVYRLTITDPVKVTLIDAQIEITMGGN